MSDDFPRFVAITWQHPTPYYDDSYAVNSVNNGPYQDALLTELVPLLEKQFRLIAEANARFLTGGSTGGWECARAADSAPRFLRRRLVPLPRPRRFPPQPARGQLQRYQRVHRPTATRRRFPERYMMRTPEGQPQVTQREMSQLEAVLGSHAPQRPAVRCVGRRLRSDRHGRLSGPPLGPAHGHIDKTVAAYWRDNGYDLTWNMKHNWTKIGPQLAGEDAHVRRRHGQPLPQPRASTSWKNEASKFTDPKANFAFDYGRPMKPHGWQPMTNARDGADDGEVQDGAQDAALKQGERLGGGIGQLHYRISPGRNETTSTDSCRTQAVGQRPLYRFAR